MGAEGEAGKKPAREVGERTSAELIFYPLAIALAALLIAVPLVYFSTAEFSQPDLGPNPTGMAALIVAGKSYQSGGIGIDDTNGVVRYDILFPFTDKGQRWTLVLGGSAAPTSIIPFPGGNNPHHFVASCNPGSDGVNTQASSCTYFTGVVGSPSGGGGPEGFTYGCRRLANPDDPTTNNFAFAVEIAGTAPISESDNWAYKTVSYPYILPADTPSQNEGSGIDARKLAPESHTIPSVVCDTMVGPPGYEEFVHSIPSPNGFSGNEEEWDNPSSAYVSAVFKRSNAETLANVGIILAGACFAIVTGFLPLSYQAWLGKPRHTPWFIARSKSR